VNRKTGDKLGGPIDTCRGVLSESARIIITNSIGKFVEVGLAALINEGDSYENTAVRTLVAHNISAYLDNIIHITQNGLLHLNVLIKDGIYLDEMRLRSAMPEAVAQQVCKPFKPGYESERVERHEATKVFSLPLNQGGIHLLRSSLKCRPSRLSLR